MKEKKCDFIIAGLGFGDEGKGTITDYLVSKYKITSVIRYNGGSQAAHTVVTPDGISHIFCQFSSGTFIEKTKTVLSSQMLIDPYSILEEEHFLKQKGIYNAMKRLVIDKNSMIITPFHKMLGQVQELNRGKERFSSTGKGVGQAVFDLSNYPESVLRIKDFLSPNRLKQKLEYHCFIKLKLAEEILALSHSQEARKVFTYFKKKYNSAKLFRFYTEFANSYSSCIDKKGNYLTNLFQSKSSILFEGAQGALLDPEFGFVPYITKTNTRFDYAEQLISKKNPVRIPIRIGVLRAYSHRHGNGPLPTESVFLSKKILEEHNVDNPWQGAFRIGWLDIILCRYGIKLNNHLDSIALTCLDQLSGISKIKVCISYGYSGMITDDLVKHFQFEEGKGKVKIIGINPINSITSSVRLKLTEVMLKCKPLEYLEFKGWNEDISFIHDKKELPGNLKNFLDFLESKDGFNTPISILSLGKTRNHKIIYRELF